MSEITIQVLPPSEVSVEVAPPPVIEVVLSADQGPKGAKGDTGDTGPQGATGPQGPPGTDKHYTHDQMTASDTWTVVHNLGKFPAVSVVDSAGSEVEGLISHVSNNSLILEFSAAFSGKAYCN